MKANGVVGRRKQGNFVYYRVIDDGIWQLCHDVCGSVARRLNELKPSSRRSFNHQQRDPAPSPQGIREGAGPGWPRPA